MFTNNYAAYLGYTGAVLGLRDSSRFLHSLQELHYCSKLQNVA